ncbi:MAG: hypothetical protein JWM12_4128, partial [Ilumatobacteraceae bacterium]|nr:hypothetical protein [Ilumatobacteraceae bacterium]
MTSDLETLMNEHAEDLVAASPEVERRHGADVDR